MNDLQPFKHGEEGYGSTHYACDEVLKKMGGKATCCECNGHKCLPDQEPSEEKICGVVVDGNNPPMKTGHACFNKKPCPIHTSSPDTPEWENEINAILPILKCELTMDGKMEMIRKIVRSLLQKKEKETIVDCMEVLGLKAEELPAFPPKDTDTLKLILAVGIARKFKEARTQTLKEVKEMVEGMDIVKWADGKVKPAEAFEKEKQAVLQKLNEK